MKARSSFSFLTLLFVLVLAACEQEGGYSAGDAPAADEKFAEYATKETRKVLGLSDSVTQQRDFTYPDGGEIVHRVKMPRHVQMAKGEYELPGDFDAVTPGDVLATIAPHEMPSAIAVGNTGEIIFSNRGGTIVYNDDGATEDLLDATATVIQWDKEADSLLVSGPGNRLILDWPERTVAQNLTDLETPGYLLFSPWDEGLWIISDLVDLSAGSKYRVFWNLWSLDRDGNNQEPLSSMPVQLSSVGSFPKNEIAWGHEAQEYKVFPDPAPIWELDQEWNPVKQLTEPDAKVDIRPSVSEDGELFFVRMSRLIETQHGLLAGATSRAWYGNINDSGIERMIAAEPVSHIAVSPNGKWVALVLIRENEGKLVRIEKEKLLQRDLSPQISAQQEFEKNMQAVLADIRASFAQTEMGQTLEETAFGPEASIPPTVEAAKEMATQLRESIQKHLGVELPEGFEVLGIIDELLFYGDGTWPEEPATIMAVAGLYGEVMNSLPETQWHLEAASPALGRNLTTATLNLANQYLTLHTPFYVARERLAGRLQLDTTARDLLESAQPPILLTEGISAAAMEIYLAQQAEKAGLSIESLSAQDIQQAIQENPHNDVINQIAFAMAREIGVPRLMTEASLNLVRNNPAKADAMIRLAKSLQEIHQYELALEVYNRAEELAPDDAATLYEVGKGFLDELKLDEAKLRIERAFRHDTTGEFHQVIQETLRQLDDTRAELEADAAQSAAE